MMIQPKLIVVRHGDTKLNVSNTVRGWLDEPLDANGVRSSWALASKLVKVYPNDIRVWSSDLRRAMQTAQPIATHYGTNITPSYFLRPWNAGSLTGKPIKGLEQILTYYGLHPNEAPDGGEPIREMLNRLIEAYNFLVNRDEQAIVVTHTRPINILAQWIDEGQPKALTTYAHIEDIIEPLGLLLVYQDDNDKLCYIKENL